MWVLAILWLDVSYAVGSVRAADASILLTGLVKGAYSVIDCSMRCGSFDVGVSVPAACSSAASSVVQMVYRWTFLCVPWTLDCFCWIQSGCLSRLMATVGCMRAAALFVVTNLLIVDLLSSAAAFGGLFNQVTVLAAAAAAAAILVVHALFFLNESAAGAKKR